MRDQPWDFNQTWPLGQKWCRFTNGPHKKWGLPNNFEEKNTQIWTTFSRLPHPTPHISGTKRRIDKKMSIYNVSPKR